MNNFIKATIVATANQSKEANELFVQGIAAIKNIKSAKAFQQVNDICVAALFNLGLQEASQTTIASNTYIKEYLKALITLTASIQSEDLTEIVHDLSLRVKEYQIFGQMASKMGGQYKKAKEFNLNSIEAFYLQAKQPGGMASLLDMAEMFAAKYVKDGHIEIKDNIQPQFYTQLIFKILTGKFEAKPEDDTKFDKALQYLDDHKGSFGIELDYMKLRIQAHLNFRQQKEKSSLDYNWSSWFKNLT